MITQQTSIAMSPSTKWLRRTIIQFPPTFPRAKVYGRESSADAYVFAPYTYICHAERKQVLYSWTWRKRSRPPKPTPSLSSSTCSHLSRNYKAMQLQVINWHQACSRTLENTLDLCVLCCQLYATSPISLKFLHFAHLHKTIMEASSHLSKKHCVP